MTIQATQSHIDGGSAQEASRISGDALTTEQRVAVARAAQAEWAKLSIRARLRLVRAFRHAIVDRADALASSVTFAQRSGPAETLAAEVIPLADACRFLEVEAGRVLRPRRLSGRGRPFFWRGVSVEVRRDPFGIVLIVGAGNYPLFLAGVQAIQALVAGNAVLLKPGVNSTPAAIQLTATLTAAGADPRLCQLLPEDPSHVNAAVTAGVDKVILTGSAQTGRRVQAKLAETLTPAAMELSGCDAVFVLDSANIERLVDCLAFGLRLNGSATCIAPRRVFVPRQQLDRLATRIATRLATEKFAPVLGYEAAARAVAEAVDRGARRVTGAIRQSTAGPEWIGPTVLRGVKAGDALVKGDFFAPVMSLIPVEDVEEALRLNRMCPYALGASVFGNGRDASRIAARIDAGCVVVNDMIAPTADPRVPFGGRRQSGFGVTRGAAGLEAMTQLKAVVYQRSRWLPHLDPPTPHDPTLLAGFLGMIHGDSWRTRWRAARQAFRAGWAQSQWNRQQHHQQMSERR